MHKYNYTYKITNIKTKEFQKHLKWKLIMIYMRI